MILDILVFVAVLSLLIFFHELGHFLAAKAFGIYVKRFSIGMPPRLFGIQWGETDYCVGLLPIGGFVMMAGQEDVPLTDGEREKEYGHVPERRWFKNKSVAQRTCVLLAGPLMNLVLAVLLYMIIGLLGSYVPEWEVEARVGAIEPGSPAETAPLFRLSGDQKPAPDAVPDTVGWSIGDRIESINGRKAENMTDLAISAVLGGEEKVHDIVLVRETAAGQSERYLSRISPEFLDDSRHVRFGVGPFETAVAREVTPGSPAEEAGLRAKDIILEADDKLVTLPLFIDHIENMEEGGVVRITVLRDGKRETITASPKTTGRILGLSVSAPSEAEGPVVVTAAQPSLQEKTGLHPRDILLTLNGQPATLAALHSLQEAHPEGEILVEAKRPALFFGMLRAESQFRALVPVASVRAIGVALKPQTVLQQVAPSRILPHAVYQSYLAVKRTVQTIVGLARRTVSPKDLGGPVMIFAVTTRAAEAGLDWLIKITAFISVNLFIINLLPLPVLDGGQVVTNLVEAVRGKPLNERILERMQQLGIAFLVALMLFVTYNDIERWILGWFP